jgi:hypothetical protein
MDIAIAIMSHFGIGVVDFEIKQNELIWHDKNNPKPTQLQLEQWWDEYIINKSSLQYKEDRKSNGHILDRTDGKKNGYKDVGCQLDNFYHDIAAGFFGENAKNGQFFLQNKTVKEEIPPPI